MTPDLLKTATGCTDSAAQTWAAPITAACERFGIVSPQRQAAFLAQTGYETQNFAYLTELWGPTPSQTRYEGRADLGNVQEGDGFRFRGRGLLQTTGRANYKRVSVALDHDFLASPADLAASQWAALAAGVFWTQRGLNELADADDINSISVRINGGTNGLAARARRYGTALAALTVQRAP